MRRKLLFFVLAIMIGNIASAQWLKSRFDSIKFPAATPSSDIFFEKSGSIVIYDRGFHGTEYYSESNDNGNTWGQRNITPLLFPLANYVWALNSIEPGPDSSIYLSVNYKGAYEWTTSYGYLLFQSMDFGATWKHVNAYTSDAFVHWDTASSKNTISKDQSIWYSQPLNKDTAVATSLVFNPAVVEIYTYSTPDEGKSWSYKQLLIDSKPVTTNTIPGYKMLNENDGFLLLQQKYLTTNDGGDSWTEHTYPFHTSDTDIVATGDVVDKENIIVSTGKDVIQFASGATVSKVIYHDNDSLGEIYKVKYDNGLINLLTSDGYYIREAYSPTNVGAVTLTENEFKLYPNPTFSSVTIIATNDAKGNSAKIYDVAGRLIDQKMFISNTVTFDVHSLAPGNYFATIQTNNGEKAATLKWVKQ